MKLYFNNKEIFKLSETQMKVIKNDILSEIFEDDMTRRARYWIESPCEKYVHKRRKNIEEELRKKNLTSFPTNLLKLGRKFADEYPSKYGHSHITRPLKCKVGDQEFEFSIDHQIIWTKIAELSQPELNKEEFEKYTTNVLEKRMSWILQHKYEKCLEKLKLQWIPKLEARGITEIPADDEEFAKLVFSQSDYKNRSQRELDSDNK